MDYKKEMKRLEKGREKYFPVMDALMDMKLPGDGPSQITDPEMMRVVLELLDIGYLDPDAFVVNKKFSEIRGLFFRGGNPITAEGWKEYKRNYITKRTGLRRRLFLLAFLFFLCAAVIFIIRVMV